MDSIERIKIEESKVLAKDRLFNYMKALTLLSRLDDIERKFYLFVTNALHHSAVTIEGINTERHVYSYVLEIVRRGIETREIRSDFTAETTASMAAAAFNATLSKMFLSGAAADDTTIRAFILMLFDGIKS
jgi:hypothetical protein